MNPIETAGLTKQYGAFTALRDLDLAVRAGEVFGFLGPNGAGKSTTIRLLMGELRPTAGTAAVLGAPPRDVAHRRRLGYLPADLALWPAMTGRETLGFFAKLHGGVDRRRIDGLAQRLDANLDKRVGELSTGNRQKIGLIAAFMHDPELLILDEPNAGLDGALASDDLAGVAGVRDLAVLPGRIELNFDGDMARLLEAVTARTRLRDIRTQEAELEDIFLTYYQDAS